MSKHDLQAKPIYHRKREAAGWSIRKFVRTARRYRTIEIQADPHTHYRRRLPPGRPSSSPQNDHSRHLTSALMRPNSGYAGSDDRARAMAAPIPLGSTVPRMAVDRELVDAAIELARTRFPGQHWSGAAALRLDDGAVLTSTAPGVPNSAVSLCHETGAICEAFKRGRRVVASVCVTAADADRGYWILAPCGVCQERLFAYGPDVEVAVPEPENPRRWRTLRLRDVQPYWFARVFPDDVWPFESG